MGGVGQGKMNKEGWGTGKLNEEGWGTGKSIEEAGLMEEKTKGS
jgi:hypothetical protein